MLPALLAQVGLPLLLRFVSGALGKIDNPLTRSAADAVGAVSSAIAEKSVTPEQIADANRHLETLAKLDSDDYRETIREVNATIRAETGSEDAYVRRMRPTFGYVMAATWAAQMGAVAWIVVRAPSEAAQVVAALGSLSVVWSVGLSVLGVYVYKRSADKALVAGQSPVGLIESLQRLAERR